MPLRYAGRLIADLGAAVVEVVDPTQARSDEHGAQFTRAMTIALGRNKTRVSTPSGDELAELLEQADAVMIDETTQLADDAIPDHLVVVDVSDFGSGGPQSHWRGSDLIDVAYGGGCQQNGDPDRAPLRPPAFVAEHEIGVGAAIVVLLGIIAARRDGRGQRAEVSGVDSWATIQTAIGLLEFIFQGRIAGRAGRRFAGRPYPYGILPTADGEARLICLQGREWKRSLEMMGDPEWGRDPRFADRLVNQAEHADELDDLVGQWLGVRTKDELLAAAIEFKVAWAPVRTVSELTREPQLEHRKFFWDHDGVKVPGFPATFGRIPLQKRSDALTPIEPVESVLAEAKPRARGQSRSASADAPLKGITVIDFGWAWAGGVVGSVLADFG
ncbi:MAG: CoA transferase, partial [Burkholderiales bacterium]